MNNPLLHFDSFFRKKTTIPKIRILWCYKKQKPVHGEMNRHMCFARDDIETSDFIEVDVNF